MKLTVAAVALAVSLAQLGNAAPVPSAQVTELDARAEPINAALAASDSSYEVSKRSMFGGLGVAGGTSSGILTEAGMEDPDDDDDDDDKEPWRRGSLSPTNAALAASDSSYEVSKRSMFGGLGVAGGTSSGILTEAGMEDPDDDDDDDDKEPWRRGSLSPTNAALAASDSSYEVSKRSMFGGLGVAGGTSSGILTEAGMEDPDDDDDDDDKEPWRRGSVEASEERIEERKEGMVSKLMARLCGSCFKVHGGSPPRTRPTQAPVRASSPPRPQRATAPPPPPATAANPPARNPALGPMWSEPKYNAGVHHVAFDQHPSLPLGWSPSGSPSRTR